MSDIHNSIGHNRFSGQGANDPLYLAQIQKDKEEREKTAAIGDPSSKIFHRATAIVYFRKFVDRFAADVKARSSSINTQKALEDLSAFKEILEELSREDLSYNPDFTQRLSQLWQNLYENCSGIEDSLTHLDTLASRILSFVKEIDAFPPGEDHTLGYYLTEHAGQDWIPFPFMNLLSALHQEFQDSRTSSRLELWIKQLSETISGYGGTK